MQLLRLDHDAEWELLPVHELREHEQVLLSEQLAFVFQLELRTRQLSRPFLFSEPAECNVAMAMADRQFGDAVSLGRALWRSVGSALCLKVCILPHPSIPRIYEAHLKSKGPAKRAAESIG